MVKATVSLSPLALALLLALAPSAHAATIHFGTAGDNLTTNEQFVADGTGSIPGVVDVSTTGRTGASPGSVGSETDLRYWSDNYSGGSALYTNNLIAEVTLTAVSGQITLQNFFIGAYPNGIGGTTTRDTIWSVYDLDHNCLICNVTPASVGPSGYLALVGLTGPGFNIQWTLEAYNVGINDINVEAAPVPLPAALPLFGSALAGLGALLTRRRRLNVEAT